MNLYKVLLRSTNALKDTASDLQGNYYIDIEDGYIYVSEEDLNYIMSNFSFEKIERVGLLYDFKTKE